jgi:hypothetical protein
MDNASNCNHLASILSTRIPHFEGTLARLRCLAHIINLIAKVSSIFTHWLLLFMFLARYFYHFSSKSPSARNQQHLHHPVTQSMMMI